MDLSVRPVGARGGATRLQLRKPDHFTTVLQRKEHEVSRRMSPATLMMHIKKKLTNSQQSVQSISTEEPNVMNDADFCGGCFRWGTLSVLKVFFQDVCFTSVDIKVYICSCSRFLQWESRCSPESQVFLSNVGDFWTQLMSLKQQKKNPSLSLTHNCQDTNNSRSCFKWGHVSEVGALVFLRPQGSQKSTCSCIQVKRLRLKNLYLLFF